MASDDANATDASADCEGFSWLAQTRRYADLVSRRAAWRRRIASARPDLRAHRPSAYKRAFRDRLLYSIRPKTQRFFLASRPGQRPHRLL